MSLTTSAICPTPIDLRELHHRGEPGALEGVPQPDWHARSRGELQRHADERRLSVGGQLHGQFDQQPDRWSWTFGDSNTSTVQNPSHTYAAAGSFTVALTATNSGGNNTCTKNNYITVTSPAPVANFSGTPTSGYLPLIVNFTDSSTNNPTAWSWNFGDTNVPYNTSTVQNPTKWYIDAGTYTVSLTVTNAYGNDTMTRTNYCTSSVNPAAPTPNFSATPTSGARLSRCSLPTSRREAASLGLAVWRRRSSNSQNPSHTYTSPGSYTVALYIHNGPCNNLYKTNYITVTPPAPVANFSGTPTSGAKPLSVTFTDSSTNSPTAWSLELRRFQHLHGAEPEPLLRQRGHLHGGADRDQRLRQQHQHQNQLHHRHRQHSDLRGGRRGGLWHRRDHPGAAVGNRDQRHLAAVPGYFQPDHHHLQLPTAAPGRRSTNSPQGTGTGGSSGSVALTVFWSRYNGTQGAPTTSDSGDHQIGRMIAIRGATTSGNPWDVTAGGVDATASTTATIPGATTTVANTLVVVAAAVGLPNSNGTANFSAWTNANLSSITERTDNTRNAGVGGGIGVATGGKATAGAYGNTTVTLGGFREEGHDEHRDQAVTSRTVG